MDQYAIQEKRTHWLQLCHHGKKYSPSENSFQCTLNVQSNRPVYGATYTTTTFAFNDVNFNFNYQEYDQIDFRPDVIDNNLTATLAYYVYLIIGTDMDAMSPLGGTEYLQTAQNIVTNAQGLSEKDGKLSRITRIAMPSLPTF